MYCGRRQGSCRYGFYILLARLKAYESFTQANFPNIHCAHVPVVVVDVVVEVVAVVVVVIGMVEVETAVVLVEIVVVELSQIQSW